MSIHLSSGIRFTPPPQSSGGHHLIERTYREGDQIREIKIPRDILQRAVFNFGHFHTPLIKERFSKFDPLMQMVLSLCASMRINHASLTDVATTWLNLNSFYLLNRFVKEYFLVALLYLFEDFSKQKMDIDPAGLELFNKLELCMTNMCLRVKNVLGGNQLKEVLTPLENLSFHFINHFKDQGSAASFFSFLVRDPDASQLRTDEVEGLLKDYHREFNLFFLLTHLVLNYSSAEKAVYHEIHTLKGLLDLKSEEAFEVICKGIEPKNKEFRLYDENLGKHITAVADAFQKLGEGYHPKTITHLEKMLARLRVALEARFIDKSCYLHQIATGFQLEEPTMGNCGAPAMVSYLIEVIDFLLPAISALTFQKIQKRTAVYAPAIEKAVLISKSVSLNIYHLLNQAEEEFAELACLEVSLKGKTPDYYQTTSDEIDRCLEAICKFLDSEKLLSLIFDVTTSYQSLEQLPAGFVWGCALSGEMETLGEWRNFTATIQAVQSKITKALKPFGKEKEEPLYKQFIKIKGILGQLLAEFYKRQLLQKLCKHGYVDKHINNNMSVEFIEGVSGNLEKLYETFLSAAEFEAVAALEKYPPKTPSPVEPIVEPMILPMVPVIPPLPITPPDSPSSTPFDREIQETVPRTLTPNFVTFSPKSALLTPKSAALSKQKTGRQKISPKDLYDDVKERLAKYSNPREFLKVLEQLGWKLIRQRSSHEIYKKNNKRLVVPIHQGRTIPRGLFINLVKQAFEKC